MGIFQNINSKFIINQIEGALESVIYVSPGLIEEIANSIIKIKKRVNNENIKIIIDSDPGICRLGYGDIKSIELLLNEEININKVNSLRVGVLIIDGIAWVYSPIPLIIEDDEEIKLNGVNVTIEQAIDLIDEIYEIKNEKNIQTSIFDIEMNEVDEEPAFSPQDYIKDDLETAKRDLEIRPPKKFDLERQVQVYTGYFQFVELSLVGMGLRRMTLAIPSKLLAVSGDKEVQDKLKATYKLINENSKLTGKEIEDKVNHIRKTYTRSMGKRLGNVILLRNKEILNREVNNIRKDITIFSNKVKKSLERELAYTKKEISKILVPIIMKNPPDDLKGVITTNKPTKKVATEYIDDQISKFLPNVQELITEMKLECDFKDITYEMMNDPLFQENLNKHFKYENFDKPYKLYSAVELR